MSKGNSGHFKGANGAHSAGGGGGSGSSSGNNEKPPLFVNGHVTKEGIESNREELPGKTVEQIAELLKQNGYMVHIRQSKLEKKGSKAVIIGVDNPSKQRNITQIQVSPGGGLHGKDSYVKISTRDQGKIKIVKGSPDDYKHGENENAHLIFTEGTKK